MESAFALPSAADLLQTWESGQGSPTIAQALFLLSTAYPGESSQALSQLPIGQRDRRLLQLRRWLFGPRLESVVVCPHCSERLELTFDLDDIQAPEPEEDPGAWELDSGGYRLRFRLPNSLDLLAAQQTGGRMALLESCLLEARRDGRRLAAARLPESVRDALIRRLAELDPQADVRFPVACPVCEHSWMAVFDIVTFLWQELHTWALHTLDDVHTLASAYAWREADILALSPWRRRYYVSMVTG